MKKFTNWFLVLVLATLLGCNDIRDAFNFLIGKGMDEYNKGVEYQQVGETALAEQSYKLALQKNPGLAEAYMNLGLIYINGGKYDDAVINIGKAIDILEKTHRTAIKESTWQQLLSIAYNNLGVVYQEKGDWSKAILFYTKATELDPYNSEAQTNIQEAKLRDAAILAAIDLVSKSMNKTGSCPLRSGKPCPIEDFGHGEIVSRQGLYFIVRVIQDCNRYYKQNCKLYGYDESRELSYACAPWNVWYVFIKLDSYDMSLYTYNPRYAVQRPYKDAPKRLRDRFTTLPAAFRTLTEAKHFNPPQYAIQHWKKLNGWTF